ncbi:sugar ABC transporter permease [Niallia sp.]|uniref:carbohydrate ABC transporter permease n=1 Tax=Niallia sp. TaxID=2837523 RepID=UPI00289F7D58|nr:sugar ABC transporter permease [Niallia sp.]
METRLVEEATITSNVASKQRRMKINRRWFFIFISPWLIGFLGLTVGPMIYSFIMSFTDWDMLTKMEFVGLDNYINLFKDQIFLLSVKNTFIYALMSVPVSLLVSLGMAYLLSFKLKGMRFFRTLYYLPAIVPVVASSILFTNILAANGLLNKVLGYIGIQGPAWLLEKGAVLYGFVLLALWGVGGTMVLLLSAINSIGDEMYEAAMMEGASRFKMFRSITIPLISPVIFFNLITGIIGSLQTFTQVYLLTDGGPDNASSMIVPYLYKNAFSYYRMGYASAMAWVLFAIILVLSLIVLRSSKMWVFYEEEVK